MYELFLKKLGFKISGKVFPGANNTYYFDYKIPFEENEYRPCNFKNVDILYLSCDKNNQNITLLEKFIEEILMDKKLIRNNNYAVNKEGFIDRMNPKILVSEEELFYINLKYGELFNDEND